MKKILKILIILSSMSLNGCKSSMIVSPFEAAPKEHPGTSDDQYDKIPSENLNKIGGNIKVQVALFLPFSGKNKELGWNIFNAATLSLFANDMNNNVELVMVDSKDTPAEAAQAFKEIVNRKIKIVIGPVFSSAIEAIENDVKRNEITVISLSNNQQLADKMYGNGGIFIAGMIPEMQIDKIVSFALDKGKFSFAIIAPNNQYGTTIHSIFKEVVKNRDATLVTAEFYENGSDKTIDRVVNRVINSFTLSSRITRAKNKKNLVVTESDKIYPQVIMVPESGKVLSKIAASIKNQNGDERNFKIIGTSQWDDISTVNDPNLVGSWFAAPENKKFREFEKSYFEICHKQPVRVSSLVYDAVALVSKMVDYRNGEIPTAKNFVEQTNPPKNGFEGIDGLFRFLPNGLVQRNLAVLQVGNGKFEIAEEPLDRFLKY